MIQKRLTIVLLCVLPSCIGPKYKVPDHAMPRSFEYQQHASQTEENLNTWWQQFNDPILNEFINQALKNNYDLRIAIEKIEEARAFYQIKQAELFPQIDIVAQANRTKFSSVLAQESFLQDDRVSFFQLGFDAFWEIDFWGKIWHARNARFFTFQAQIEQMRNVYIILLADVARSYIDLCALNRKIMLATDLIYLNTELLELEKDLFDAGLSDEIFVDRQQQLLARSQDFFLFLQTALVQRKNQLAVLLGINPEQLAIPVRDMVPLSQTQLSVGIPSELLRRRPDIRQAERLVAAANELVGQAIAEWFPSFTLLGGLSSESSTLSKWFSGGSLTWFIGPSVRWPLINFGRIKSNIEVQESKKRQTILAYSQAIINALKEVEDFLVTYFNNQEQLAIIGNKLQYALNEQRLVCAKYESGLVNKLDCLQAAKNQIDVAIEFTDIQQALSTNLVSLYKALGGGW
jgi:NodT family efflux transporter outer membrane factor (OMF) lipoprotein